MKEKGGVLSWAWNLEASTSCSGSEWLDWSSSVAYKLRSWPCLCCGSGPCCGSLPGPRVSIYRGHGPPKRITWLGSPAASPLHYMRWPWRGSFFFFSPLSLFFYSCTSILKFSGQGLNGSHSWSLCHSHNTTRSSHIYDLHHSLRQRQIPTQWARPGVEAALSQRQRQILNHWTTMETPLENVFDWATVSLSIKRK